MDTYYVVRTSHPAGLGLERFATAFMNTQGDPNNQQAACLIENALVLSHSLRFFPELRLCRSCSMMASGPRE
jgi:hypothetical protein